MHLWTSEGLKVRRYGEMYILVPWVDSVFIRVTVLDSFGLRLLVCSFVDCWRPFVSWELKLIYKGILGIQSHCL
jgi:hypothetical protein